MRDIDSDALSQVQRQLGISGVGTGVAMLEDDELRQVLDVGPAVRRGRADVANGGWFWGVLVNEHAGASSLSSFINPYEPMALSLTSFPPLVDVSRFDIWIAGATLRLLSGATSIADAALIIGAPLRSLAFGKTDSGAGITPSGGGFVIQSWGTKVVASDTFTYMLPEVRVPFETTNIRMPRGSNLVFDTQSIGVSTYELSIIMGLFPIGLGNDILGSG